MEAQASDMVNNPPHYRQCGIECIDAMIAAFGEQEVEIFCRLNAFKYLWRCKHKGNTQQDLSKANWYINKAKELGND